MRNPTPEGTVARRRAARKAWKEGGMREGENSGTLKRLSDAWSGRLTRQKNRRTIRVANVQARISRDQSGRDVLETLLDVVRLPQHVPDSRKKSLPYKEIIYENGTDRVMSATL